MASVARLSAVPLPKFGDKMDPADGKAIWNFCYQMVEQTLYLFQNIAPENFSDEARSEYDGILIRISGLEAGESASSGGSTGSSTGEILARIGALESRAALMEGTAEALNGRMKALEEANKTLSAALAELEKRVAALEIPEGGQ